MRKRATVGLGNGLWGANNVKDGSSDDDDEKRVINSALTSTGSHATSAPSITSIAIAIATLLCASTLAVAWKRSGDTSLLPDEPSQPAISRRFSSSQPQPSTTRDIQSTAKEEKEEVKPCQRYDEAYFSQLLETVRLMPPNASVMVTSNASSPLCVANVTPLDKCQCLNPFVPTPQNPDRVRTWHAISQKNIDLIHANYSTSQNNNGGSNDLPQQPDLVLYGDSITERLLGRFFGRFGPKMKDYAHVTYQLMNEKGGGLINGLPMGISSDEISHLLYRLQHGELPVTVRPTKAWWILIGTNDLKAGCSIDAIVAGNIRIVQELRQHDGWQSDDTRGSNKKNVRPVVINSILPRGRQPLVLPGNAMWQMITEINQQLACYASLSSHDNTTFFANVTDLFVQARSSDGKCVVHPDMFVQDSLHPSVNGSRIWEEYMVDRVLSLASTHHSEN